MASLTILNQGSSTNITGLSPVTGAVSVTDEVMIYDSSAAGNRKATVLELVPDGFLSADATGRAKMADGFCTAAKMAAGAVVQVVQATKGTLQTVTTSLPYDNSVPTSLEGEEVITASITPSSATNKVLVRAVINGTTFGSANWSAALFRGSEANAISAAAGYGNGYVQQLAIEFLDSPGTPSAITYRVRAGGNGVNFFLNGASAGTGIFNGVCLSSLTLTEIVA